jgi:transcription-repair coupling factor (superfamily II helicase)
VENLKIVKLPLHLIPLFIEGKSVVYSEYLSNETLSVFQKIEILKKNKIFFNTLKNKLNQNFLKVDAVSGQGEYTIRGDSIIAWLWGYDNPLRITFFGESCEEIVLLNNIDFHKIKTLEKLIILPFNFDISNIRVNDENSKLNFFVFTRQHVIENNTIDTQITLPGIYFGNLTLLQKDVKQWKSDGYKIFIDVNQNLLPPYLKQFFSKIKFKYVINKNTIEVVKDQNINFNLPAGFVDKQNKIVYLTEREVFGTIKIVNKDYKIQNKNVSKLLAQFEGEIKINDYVVHEDYGVGLYQGLEQQIIDNELQEYILIEYKKGDRVYVPIHQLYKVSKYIGPEGYEPELATLGSTKWKNTKKKIKIETRRIAKELIEHFAKRTLSNAIPVKIKDSQEYKNFINLFPYELTEDQRRTLKECEVSISKTSPMDRLLIGDVGFGKTEILLRLSFRVVENGGQVLILAPTTVLVAQHFKIFSKRFEKFNYKVDFVSRFKSTYENKEVLNKVKNGDIDIVIGTHRLLSNDVEFDKLQLIIVDEEQKFGVRQKEKIKKLNLGAHLISVSATPIPRTLSMALSSIQELSTISTPPPTRKSINTFLVKNDWNKIIDAINFELDRGGQVYFVHNYINSIYSLEAKIKKFLPSVKIKVAHGRLKPDELDQIMFDFYNQDIDILLTTTIIENGLDIENVNTIIIDKAENLGLSQLYQLRGRVGRGDREAYCYLFYSGKNIDSQNNKKYLERLKTIVENQDLGAGYRIASKDLEIRGAGNILGKQQHGHINSVGYALYIQLLAQEVERLKGWNKK